MNALYKLLDKNLYLIFIAISQKASLKTIFVCF